MPLNRHLIEHLLDARLSARRPSYAREQGLYFPTSGLLGETGVPQELAQMCASRTKMYFSSTRYLPRNLPARDRGYQSDVDAGETAAAWIGRQ